MSCPKSGLTPSRYARPTRRRRSRVQVHECPPQVGVECLGRAQVSEPTDDPDERLLDQILGLRPVARE